jgi:pimeloyl-ACP methyl ester carboxylesterase
MANSWYHRAIPGLGRHVDEVADSLRQMIQAIQPSQVITIGQSMGAYAAIMFGALLQVDRIVAFGPLSFFCPKQAVTFHDRRWLSVMMDLDQNPPPVRYLDLPDLLRKMGEKPELHVFFGTKPDAGATESVNLDVLHAMRYQPLRNCHLHPYPEADHTVVKYLIDTEQINDLLGKYIRDLDVSLTSSSKPVPSDWHGWIRENLGLGASQDELLDVLMQHGFGEYESRVALYRATAADGG